MKVIDTLKSLFYRLIKTEASNPLNACRTCKKRRKNFDTFPKKHTHIGYDRILNEWVSFNEHNMYAKTWAMNGYLVNIVQLNDDLGLHILSLCTKCISSFFDKK